MYLNPKIHWMPGVPGSRCAAGTRDIFIGTGDWKMGGYYSRHDVHQDLGHEIGHAELGHGPRKNKFWNFIDEIDAWDWALTKSGGQNYHPGYIVYCLKSYINELQKKDQEQATRIMWNLIRRHFSAVKNPMYNAWMLRPHPPVAVPVEGFAVKFPGYEQMEFFVYADPSQPKSSPWMDYAVAEKRTGYVIAWGRDPEEAYYETHQVLMQNSQKWWQDFLSWRKPQLINNPR